MAAVQVPTSGGGAADGDARWRGTRRIPPAGPRSSRPPLSVLGDIDLVLVAAGILGDQAQAEADVDHAIDILTSTWWASPLPCSRRRSACAPKGTGRSSSSPRSPGLRGRRANYVYGASKAGLDALAEGVQSSLAGSGAHLLVVRPGFVHTKMTSHMESAPFATTPEVVGAAVAEAVRKGREAIHVPRLLGPVFAGFRLLPRPIFRHLPG